MIRQSFTSLAPRVLPRVMGAATPVFFHAVRTMAAAASRGLGSDPLDVLRKECLARQLCDEEGCRLPGVHWVLNVAIAPTDPTKAPNLRTVGIQRISEKGIDFVMKRGSSGTSEVVANGAPVAVLHSQGKYIPGEKAEQWRGEGSCMPLPLSQVIDLIPHFTVTSMVGSKRLELEQTDNSQVLKTASEERNFMLNKSHSVEVMQKSAKELENGDVSLPELDACIRAFRFQPDRIECMVGGPETVMWERWEWLRNNEAKDTPTGGIAWNDPKQLVPH